jgi:ABC-type uncharacterized transport system permease subunit
MGKFAALLRASFRNSSVERWDFLMSLGAGILNEVTLLVPLQASLDLLSRMHAAPGATAGLIWFVFGYTRLIRSLYGMLLQGVEDLPYLVLRGELDQVFLTPMNWVFPLAARRFDATRVGAIVVSILVLRSGLIQGQVWLPVLITIPFSLVVLAQIHLIISLVVSFWLYDPQGTMSALGHRTLEFYQYPEQVYPAPVRGLLWWLPTSLFAFPVARLAVLNDYQYLWLQLVGLALLSILTAAVARAGRRRYQGAGG